MSDFTPQECATLLEWAAVLRMGKYVQTKGMYYDPDSCRYCATGAWLEYKYEAITRDDGEHLDACMDDLPEWIYHIYALNDRGTSFHDMANLFQAAAYSGSEEWLWLSKLEENLIRVKQRL